ncbi:MAG: HAD family phosphatase [Verrucomicrobia bacterium]|nr:HAD family phosphatase [Verrucomicrobiota bacterium]
MKLEIPEGPFGAYIFDCDGTLADSMPIHYAAFLKAFDHLGIDIELSEEVYYGLAGVPVAEFAQYLEKKFRTEIDSHQLDEVKSKYYRESLDQIQPVQAVVELLKNTVGKLPIAVASGGTRHCVNRTLKIIGIEDLVDAVVTAEDVQRGKPAPDIFLKSAELLGVDPKGCLVFEDAALGIKAAHAAGMQTVHVETHPYANSAW